ncbi:MAG: hypothetical protein F6K48_18185 [Okeania sp. SIO3H1]|nr:hypothetical protein [Okeania sp. SIO3H1]
MNSITDIEIREFEKSIDSWILKTLATNITTFEQLITSLPSVYPSTVLNSIQRLVSEKKISRQVMDNILKTDNQKVGKTISLAHQISLPVPHPLDYDWRFSDVATTDLLNQCQKLTSDDSKVALIGTPSLLRMGIEISYPRELILLEASQAIISSLAQITSKEQVVQCDVMRDSLPQISAEAVVLDPPWYPEYINSFLWAACQICQVGGYILISLPPLGTRPGMEREWKETLNWAKQIGLTLYRLDELALSYQTPIFELNSLKAEGISQVSKEWRRSNLAIFQRTHQTFVPRPTVSHQQAKWIEELLDGVRIRVKQQNVTKFLEPSLKSILPGDVLQSVSRRDRHRPLADVWTSGNRIFACQGCGILLLILQALRKNQSTHQAVESALKRSLNNWETKQVSYTTHQIIELIEVERKENLIFEG